MNPALIEKVTHQLENLPDDVIDLVLGYVTTLQQQQASQGTPGKKLLKFAGTLRTEDRELMLRAIEEDCRRVNGNEW
jgi:hypothetical protein